jgi:penicillin-binding protein 1A
LSHVGTDHLERAIWNDHHGSEADLAITVDHWMRGMSRREPSFGSGLFDMRTSAEDRPLPKGRKSAGHKANDRTRRDDDDPRDNKRGDNRRRGNGGGRKRRGSGRSFLGRLVYWCFVMGLWAALGLGGLVLYHASHLPPIDQLSVPKRPPNIAILAADGTLIANRGETGGRTINIRELPPYLPNAFIAIEDRRFHSHWGIDPVGIGRALVRNITARGVSQGGSTLTQQLAKNLFLTQERTASRKIQEAILALWLEQTYSKDQILELYLNRVYFGAGAYGVEAAAQRYFGKSARSVTLAEAAMLAGLVQAPSRLAPNRNPDAAEKRAQLVIAAMNDQGLISENSAKTALVTPAEAVDKAGVGSINYAADHVMDLLDDYVGGVESDVTVLTTIDPKTQAQAETALSEALNTQGGKLGVTQGAMVAMAPDGAIRALIGGRNYSKSQFNRATSARRQPGSAFKPFVYLAAMEAGLTPDTIRDDSPIRIKGWAPENYSRDYRGPVTLQTALSLSLNTIAVKLAQEVGIKNVIKVAQRLGINSSLQPNASLALGTGEVSPLELTAAFAAFANGGTGVTPFVIREVKTTDGKLLFKREGIGREGGGLGPVISAQPLAMMNSMMRETLLTGTGRKAEIAGWEAAGKTGTTQEFRDAWFVGYTSRLVASVWLGNDDNEPMKKVSGGGLPSEIWGRFMKAAHQGAQPAGLPGGLWRDQPGLPSGAAPAIAQSNQPMRGTGQRPVPPASIDGDRPWTPPSQSSGEKGFFERLFGG